MTKLYRLTLDDKVKAIDWLRANGPQLTEGRPTYPELGRQLSAVVGVPIAPGTASSLCKAAGVAWAPRQDRPGPTLRQAVVMLRELSGQVADLRSELRSLASALGHPTPLLDSHQDEAGGPGGPAAAAAAS